MDPPFPVGGHRRNRLDQLDDDVFAPGELPHRLADAVNDSGTVYWTASELDGRPMIRVSVGQSRTEQRHLDALWSLIDELA